jgi:hypothetical protein
MLIDDIGKATLIIFVGVVFKMMASYLTSYGKKIHFRQRIGFAVFWIPKTAA